MGEIPDGASVMKNTETGDWEAWPDFIRSNRSLGPFDTKEEAVKAVREAHRLRDPDEEKNDG